MGKVQELIAYKKAYDLAIKIHMASKNFPVTEKYVLIDQIRRSSRSVCANLAEAYTRRRSLKYFISKLNDAQSENSETQVWLDFSKDFSYIDEGTHNHLVEKNNEVGKLLHYMIEHPEKFK